MTVASISQSMLNYLGRFDSDRRAILTNKIWNGDYKTQQANKLFQDSIAGAENLAVNMWGAIETTDSGQYLLSVTGAVWSEIAASLRDISAADTAAGTPKGDTMHNIARVNSIASVYGTAPELNNYYHHLATDQERVAMQDYLAGQVQTNDADMNRFIRFLDSERAARLNTPVKQAAITAHQRLFSQIDAGYIASKMLIDEFGRSSWALNMLPNLIFFKKSYQTVGQETGNPTIEMSIEVERCAYGIVIKNQTVFVGSME